MYAASVVSFNLGGTVSYEIEDVFVNITTKIYSHAMYSANQNASDCVMVENYGTALGLASFASNELYNKVEELSSTKLSEIDTNEYTFVKEYSYSTVTDGEPEPITDLDLKFNSSDALTYFIVINVENLSEEPVYAVIQDNIVNAENTVQLNTGVQQNILKGEENRNMVIGFGVADITTPIDENSQKKAFSYGIKVGIGDITDTEENKSKLSINYDTDLDAYKVSIKQTAKGAVVVPETYNDGINGEKNVVATAPIKNVTISSVTSLLALLNEGITSVYLPSTINTISKASFAANIALTKITGLENVTGVEDYAFTGCVSVIDVVLPTHCSLGNSSFQYCANLASFKIPTSISSLPDHLLSGCSSLKEVVIPNSIENIGSFAFFECSALQSLVIPYSVTSIESSAFYFCTSLESIIIEEGNTKYTSKISGEETNCLIEKGESNSYKILQGCNNSIILYGITDLGDYAFAGCTSLTSITIPESVNTIGGYVFDGCTGLSSVTIGDSVETIGTHAFYGWIEEQSIYFEGTSMPENLATNWNSGCDAKIYLNGVLQS